MPRTNDGQSPPRLLNIKEVALEGLRVQISTYSSAQMPPAELTTAAFALTFDSAGRILMTRHAKRGWDIPGGHIEPGESATGAACRETLEETSTIIADLTPIGYDRIEVMDPRPDGYRYPYPVSYQAFFIANAFRTVGSVRPNAEVLEAAFVEPAQALVSNWFHTHSKLAELAYSTRVGGDARLRN